MADGRQEHVAAWLVRLGLERDAQVVARGRGCARSTGRPPPCSGRARPARPWRRRPRTPSRPPHMHVTPRRRARPRGRWRRTSCAPRSGGPRVVRRERAVLEDGLGEQVRRRHRHLHAGLVEGLRGSASTIASRSAATSRTARGRRRGSSRRTAPSSASRWTDSTGSSVRRTSCPNGSRPGLPDRPQTERELVLGAGCEIGHGRLHWFHFFASMTLTAWRSTHRMWSAGPASMRCPISCSGGRQESSALLMAPRGYASRWSAAVRWPGSRTASPTRDLTESTCSLRQCLT